MSHTIDKSRRDFLKLTSLTAGGFVLGFNWFSNEVKAAAVTSAKTFADTINFNSYLSIAGDGVITLYSPNPELGQNIMTSFPMIVAEELDAAFIILIKRFHYHLQVLFVPQEISVRRIYEECFHIVLADIVCICFLNPKKVFIGD